MKYAKVRIIRGCVELMFCKETVASQWCNNAGHTRINPVLVSLSNSFVWLLSS